MIKKKELTESEIAENNRVYEEMQKQFLKGDIKGFMENIDKAREKGFVNEKQYKYYANVLAKGHKTRSSVSLAKDKVKEIFTRKKKRDKK